jgi:hypothetical protein
MRGRDTWLALNNRISSSGKRPRPRPGRRRWKSLAERLTERTASAADRKANKTVREAEKAEKKARDAERAEEAKRDAAIQAERAKVESAERERGLQAENKAARDARYAARKSRSKRK